MNTWIVVILVIAIVFAALFFMLRGNASAQGNKPASIDFGALKPGASSASSGTSSAPSSGGVLDIGEIWS